MATAVHTGTFDQLDHVVQASKDAMKTIRHKAQDLEEMKYELVHQVRREPIKAVGIALGAGLLLGALTGVACGASLAGARANGRSK